MNIFDRYINILLMISKNPFLVILLGTLLLQLILFPLEAIAERYMYKVQRDLHKYIEGYTLIHSYDEKENYKMQISKFYKKCNKAFIIMGSFFLLNILFCGFLFFAIEQSNDLKKGGFLSFKYGDSSYILPIVIAVLMFIINKYVVKTLTKNKGIEGKILTLIFILIILITSIRSSAISSIYILLNLLIVTTKLLIQQKLRR